MNVKQKISLNLFLAVIVSLLFTTGITAQVTTGSAETATPKVSANALGVLSPQDQVSLTDLFTWPLSGPATNGTLVYNTNESTGVGIYYWKDDKWVALNPPTTTPANSWSLNGNTGTNPAIHFIGATDNQPLIFKVNNDWAGYTGFENNPNVSFGWRTNPAAGWGNTALGAQALEKNSGPGNTAVGLMALNANSSGQSNVAIGDSALAKNTGGGFNVAVGHNALASNTTDVQNTAIGAFSMANTNIIDIRVIGKNVAVGYKTLYKNKTGSQNVAVGTSALENNLASNNTAVGYEAMRDNTDSGFLNTAIGLYALRSNISGNNNMAAGAESLMNNTAGIENVGSGFRALYSNINGQKNTAVGAFSMQFNLGGEQNVAIGSEALLGNTGGGYNTAVGVKALWGVNTNGGDTILLGGGANDNTAVGYEAMSGLATGVRNTAVGVSALKNNSTGNQNTAIGMNALSTNTTGSNNTAIGYGANVGAENLNNATAIGYGAVVNESNQVRIGNDAVTSIGGAVDWYSTSDSRIKKNIQLNVPGIAFINKLKPVTYNLDLDAIDRIQRKGTISTYSPDELEARNTKQQIVNTGFIAQEVEEASKSLDYDFSGVLVPKTENNLYQLSYSQFVVPLVKAVQELNAQNEIKKASNASLQKQIDELSAQNETKEATIVSLQKQIDELKEQITHLVSGSNKQN